MPVFAGVELDPSSVFCAQPIYEENPSSVEELWINPWVRTIQNLLEKEQNPKILFSTDIR